MERTKRHLPTAALSVLLSLTLAFCMIPAPAFAIENEQEPGSAEAGMTGNEAVESSAQEAQESADTATPDAEPIESTPDEATDEGADEATESGSENQGESSQPEEQKTQVPVPQGKELVFNGEWQLGIDPAEGWTFACTDGIEGHFSAESGCMRMDAGDYSCTLRLKEGFVWNDGSTADKTVAWSIKPKPIAAPIAAEDLTESGDPQRGITEGEGYELSGDIEATEAGDYSATATLLPNYIWDDGTTEPKQIEWKINNVLEPQYDFSVRNPRGGVFAFKNWVYDYWFSNNYSEYNQNYQEVSITSNTFDFSNPHSKNNIGTHKIKYSLNQECPWDLVWQDGTTEDKFITVTITTIDINKCSVELEKNTFNYNGKAHTPDISLVHDNGYFTDGTTGYSLHENEDYTVSYKSNVNAGTALAVIKGINGFYGTMTVEFTIKPISISKGKVTLSSNKISAKEKNPPTVQLIVNGKVLTPGKDYETELHFSNSGKNAEVTITGKGNYRNSLRKKLSVITTKKGWLKQNSNWYYSTANGLASGWKKIGGSWYYFNPSSKEMETGWKTINGKKYHFTKSGAMESSCWKSNGKNWFYLTNSGAAKSGWLNSGGTWYYLDSSTKAMQTGLKKIDGKRYYFDKNGAMASSSWKQINVNWYYLTNSGAAKSGWLNSGGTWYYFDPSTNQMQTGPKKISGNKYFFQPDGSMARNDWKQIKGEWHYFTSSGSEKHGWLKWGKEWYWFDSDGAAASCGAIRTGNSYNVFNDDGTWLQSLKKTKDTWQRVIVKDIYPSGNYCSENDYWYYVDKNGKLAGIDGWFYQEDNGYGYFFNDKGQAVRRIDLTSGAVEEWVHDFSCYRYNGCYGRYWEATGEYEFLDVY